MPDSTAQQTSDSDPTVVNGNFQPAGSDPNVRRIGLPRIMIDGRSTWESPCFWFAAGILVAFLGMYVMKRTK